MLPKIPDDVMTLVPWKGTGAPPVPTLDDRRVYEIYPGPHRDLTDFEGRRLAFRVEEDRTTLRLTGKPARVTIVWRFAHPRSARLNEAPLPVEVAGGIASVPFTHAAESRVTWR